MSLLPNKRQSVTGKTQADGAFALDLEPGHHITQIHLEVSATPSAGTLSIGIRTPGSDSYITVDSIDMTDATDYLVSVTAWADSIQFTPASFDADKSYDVFLFSGNA